MSLPKRIQTITEAGLKQFDARADPDEARERFRWGRNQIEEKLGEAHEQILRLRNRNLTVEREQIAQYVRDNGGPESQGVIDYIGENRYLSHHLGGHFADVRDGDDKYYPRE